MIINEIGNVHMAIEDVVGGAIDSVFNMIFHLPAALISMIETILNDIFNGILQNATLNNGSVDSLFKTFLGMFFIIIPLKIMYEIIKGQMTDDDRFDAKKRIINAIWASAVAVSIPLLLTFATNLQRESVSLIISGKPTENFDYGSKTGQSSNIKNSSSNTQYSKDVITAVLTSIGGMDDLDKYHTAEAMYWRIITDGGYIYMENGQPKALPEKNVIAEGSEDKDALNSAVLKTKADGVLIKNNKVKEKAIQSVSGDTLYKEPGGFNAYRRYSKKTGDTPDAFVEEGDSYATSDHAKKVTIESIDGVQTTLTGDLHIWRFNIWGLTVGVIIVAVMMFTLLFQVAMRTMLLSFYKIISPLCCLSLVSDDTTAFSVWKQSVISNLLTTVAQVFMLSFTIAAVGVFNDSLKGYPLAQLAFFIGGLSATITIPSFVSAMIGGYSAGVMAGVQQAQSVAMAGKGALMGAVGLAGAGASGASNVLFGKGSTEFKGHGGQQGGGSGESSEGTPAVTKRTKGGIAGAILGDKEKQYDNKGNLLSSKRDQSTGLLGAGRRRISDAKAAGAKIGGAGVAGMNAARKAGSGLQNAKQSVGRELSASASALGTALGGGTQHRRKNAMSQPIQPRKTLSQQSSIKK